MLDKKQLISFHLLERINKQNVLIWCYPSLKEEVRNLLVETCYSPSFREDGLFYYLRRNDTWIYVRQFVNETKKVIVVLGKNLAPDSYKVICDCFVAEYIKNGDPVNLVKLYLGLHTQGVIEAKENQSSIHHNFKTKLVGHDKKLKGIVSLFKLQTVLIYNALLLKKRVIVYHTELDALQESIFGMTSLVTKRNPTSYVIPLVQQEVNIRNLSFYLAGTLDMRLKNNKNMCDLFVNLKSGEITANLKVLLEMTKFHKDLAHFLVQATESSVTELSIVEELSNRTDDLLHSLNKLNTGRGILAEIKLKNLHPNMENFMTNLARAENIPL